MACSFYLEVHYLLYVGMTRHDSFPPPKAQPITNSCHVCSLAYLSLPICFAGREVAGSDKGGSEPYGTASCSQTSSKSLLQWFIKGAVGRREGESFSADSALCARDGHFGVSVNFC